jgi:hypothetical protein
MGDFVGASVGLLRIERRMNGDCVMFNTHSAMKRIDNNELLLLEREQGHEFLEVT